MYDDAALVGVVFLSLLAFLYGLSRFRPSLARYGVSMYRFLTGFPQINRAVSAIAFFFCNEIWVVLLVALKKIQHLSHMHHAENLWSRFQKQMDPRANTDFR